MGWYYAAVLIAVGASAGSFITALVHRLQTGETILWDRSRCPRCKATLRWYELLPILSYLFQGGRCRSCGKGIPRRYLWVELSTSFLFVAIGWGVMTGALPLPAFANAGSGELQYAGIAGLAGAFLYYACFASIGIAISAYDFLHRLIPGALVLPLAIAGSLDKAAGAFRAGDPAIALSSAAVAIGAFVFFWLIWRISHGRAMGRGDADFAFAIGVFSPPVSAVAGILFAFWIGAVYGILMLGTGKLAWRSVVPFAPFLFAGSLAALFLEDAIHQWVFF